MAYSQRNKKVRVPVVDSNNVPLMPTSCSRARRWIKRGEATYFWKKGIFCIRLNREPSGRVMQDIAVGIDPGSKREGYTVKSAAHTYLNILSDAATHAKSKVETRRNMRRGRRFRKTPCRSNRMNRARGSLPPSTKARWQLKLNVVNFLSKIYPINIISVEDIAAVTKEGQRRWNKNFSPLEVGKKWFYDILRQRFTLHIISGWDTYNERLRLGLAKTSSKLSKVFSAHCVDSWALANMVVGGDIADDNTSMLYIKPIQFHRRQLHVLQYAKKHVRKSYGTTLSMGLKRGSLVKHHKQGLCLVGGSSRGKISLHKVDDNSRLSRTINPEDCRFLSYNSWNFVWIT